MNKAAILHMSESFMAYAISLDELNIRLRADKKDKLDVSLLYTYKCDDPRLWQEVGMEKTFEDGCFSYYETDFKLRDKRFAYVFKVADENETYYLSENGLEETYDFQNFYFTSFHMPYIHEADFFEPVEWVKDAVFYQIFPERFRRGDFSKDDSYINQAWEDLPKPNSFVGGDIKGIIEKLDHIKDLGVNTLYLTPIFISPTNHKYDTIDYFEIDPQFGDKNDFRKLVEKAHSLGIRIVLDAVFNHMCHENPIFKDVRERGKESKYYDWFYIDGDKADTEKINYETFAHVYNMPKLKTSNKEVQDYLIKIGKYWIEEFDIDGRRLDVSDEVSHDFWKKFRKDIKACKADAVIIGENWHNAESFLRGDELDSIMNYAFTNTCLDYFKGKISAQEVSDKLNMIIMRNRDQANRMMLNFLDTHDTPRFITEIGGSMEKLLAALALSAVYMGANCLYYGTEVGLEGKGDPDCRRAFPWEKLDENKDLLGKIKKILAIKKHRTIKNGDIKIYSQNGLLIVDRFTKEKSLSLAINLESQREFDLSDKKILLAHNYKNKKFGQGSFVIWENY
ncbi:alpha amylase N-terminal ig-like domain-containing protein [uncultured Anaerococcus sp.]|uniref:alpha amylase N-terminal ig-like domain-containing protein n=1 Tax=uncultured Anaerococcus sp. TaxID=293428 RepID=UPI00288B7DB6|nr:alpha amylase N-terminal ig-like domain-containing protein [uncultured Anaerococcus sp.]